MARISALAVLGSVQNNFLLVALSSEFFFLSYWVQSGKYLESYAVVDFIQLFAWQQRILNYANSLEIVRGTSLATKLTRVNMVLPILLELRDFLLELEASADFELEALADFEHEHEASADFELEASVDFEHEASAELEHEALVDFKVKALEELARFISELELLKL
jgi:hypothetical protein